MDFVRVDAGDHQLGWRFTEHLGPEVHLAIETFVPMTDFLKRFSGPRAVHLNAFEISSRASLTVEELLGDVYQLDGVQTLSDVCERCDAALLERDLRLPTEDELEAAFSGSLFPWGDLVPDGAPYGSATRFRGHREPTTRGLRLLGDTYRFELTREALKLGDGGEAVCGDYPWPIAWFSMCPSFRLAGEAVDGLLVELLETTHVRPVRR